GSFAHSGGLETYTQAEIVATPDDLARLIALRLDAAARTDLIVVHEALTADRAQVIELDRLCSASKVAKEAREASEKIGRRLLASVLNLISDEQLDFYQREITAGRCAGHHAVVHGLACAALNLDPRTALLTFGYALAANQTTASLKLMRIGQTQAQKVLAESGAALESAVEAALTRTLDDFGSFTPALDIRAMQHEHLFRRLFIS
ncbi:MAG TPA: urease accessory UreF family protein, partial [Phototrophicaceae bacterium]|nr:urease accessory UreF family protein [Phototrophicaceae bacterium]